MTSRRSRYRARGRWFAALLFAASPIAAGAIGLAALRTPPAQDQGPRVLDLDSIPGLAVASLRFDRLPFDRITSNRRTLYSRTARWSILSDWNRWDITINGQPCRRRTPRGGWMCDGGETVMPDVVDVGAELWMMAVVSKVPPGHRLELHVQEAPRRLIGDIVRLSRDRPASVGIDRRGGGIVAVCSADRDVCQFTPDGEGEIVLHIDGPSPLVGIDLQEQR